MSGLSPERIHRSLAGRLIGKRIEHHERMESTNDRARELASSGEPEGTVVVTDEQTRGRGRGGRAWHSPAGLGIYLSVVLRPITLPGSVPCLGLLTAVATAEASSRITGAPCAIKWPNDVMAQAAGSGASRRKIAGILTEARTAPDAVRDLVVGIGINVSQAPADFPEGLRDRAASLEMICGHVLDHDSVVIEVLTALDDWYTLWSRDGESPVLARYEKLALDLRGRRVRITDGGASWVGTTDGLTATGALRILRDEPSRGSTHLVEIRYGELDAFEEI